MKHLLERNWLVILCIVAFFVGLALEVQSGIVDGAVLIPVPFLVLALMFREPKGGKERKA